MDPLNTELIAFDSKASGMNGFGIGDISPTLRAQNGNNNRHAGGGQVAVASEEFAVRRLTVVECARLQGFDDCYCHIETDTRRKIEADEAEYLMSHDLPCAEENGQWYTNIASDSPMYRAFGNSQAVPVMAWIGKRILLVESELALPRQSPTKF